MWLIVDMGRWLAQLDPTWIALEQVPAVLPLWEAYAAMLRERGYSTWTGVLNAADFGVPQTRQRAILMASKGRIAHPPEPTHDRAPVESLFGTLEPWVTMAEALGWGMTARPATLAGERAAGRFRVGFPRLDDLGTSEDGYRERDWRSSDEPAFVVTEKARSWIIQPEGSPIADEPAVEPGEDWVVATGMNTMSVSRDPQDMQPYERPISEPAPTVGTMSGGQWTVGPPGHRQPPHRWKVEYRRGGDRIHEGIDPEIEPAQTVTSRADRWQVNTGRAWAKDGSREDAQVVDASENPAPALTAKSGGQWHIHNTATVEPEPDEWVLNPGMAGYTDPHKRLYPLDEPAPTLALGHDSASWVFERPATTVMGDARSFQPGGHHTPGAQSENSIRLTVQDALILQSFDENYPLQGSKTAAFGQIGNAIPPRLAYAILERLI